MSDQPNDPAVQSACAHPVMQIETGLCVDCGEPIDCPPMLDFGVDEEEK